MFMDDRVLRHIGPYEVLAERQEVMWRDGTAVLLHPVRQHGAPCLLHRALPITPQFWCVVDLARSCPPLASELRSCLQRDRPGVLFYILRREFTNAGDFLARLKTAASSMGEAAEVRA